MNRKAVEKAWFGFVVGFIAVVFSLSAMAQPKSDASFSDVKKRGTLLVGMDTAELPWVVKNKATGNYEGFEYEMMALVAKKLGVKLEVVDAHWAELGKDLVEKKFDVLANAYSPNDIDSSLGPKISWSQPYYHWGWAIAVKSDNDAIHGPGDLQGKTVGCYTDGKEYFSKIKGIKNLKVFHKAAYDQVLSGKIDAFIYDSPSVYYTARTDPRLKAVGPLLGGDKVYELGFRAEDAALKKKVEGALKKVLKSSEYKAIMAKWQGEKKK